MERITLGAGCFWCTEAVFQRIKGVKSVTPGYSGGHVENPTYEDITTGTTGHAEVCQIEFDESVISLEEILEVFFEVHDPTTPNRQGNDIGPQYRSVIFYHNESQKAIAEDLKKRLELSKKYGAPIVTEITPFSKFYPAEEYHHDYYRRNTGQPYCRFVIDPKVKKVETTFKRLIRL